MTNTILILGGGVGGVVAARRLRALLPRDHRVVLVERAAEFVLQSAYLRLMLGRRSRAAITRPLANLAALGIEVVRGKVEAIDPARRAARVSGRELVGDHLVLALGAELDPAAVPGLEAAGINLYDLAGAERLHAARQEFRAGRIAVLVGALPFKCPAAPYEAAMLLEADMRRRGLRQSVAIDLYTPEAGPMPSAGPEVSRQVRGMVEAKGIGYHPEHAVAELDAASRSILFANGARAAFDLLVYVPPHRAPACAREAGLCGAGGWVEVVAHNIAAELRGEPMTKTFDGHGACFLEIGDGRAGFGSGDFYAKPAPAVVMRPPGRLMHWAKAAYERYWMHKWLN